MSHSPGSAYFAVAFPTPFGKDNDPSINDIEHRNRKEYKRVITSSKAQVSRLKQRARRDKALLKAKFVAEARNADAERAYHEWKAEFLAQQHKTQSDEVELLGQLRTERDAVRRQCEKRLELHRAHWQFEHDQRKAEQRARRAERRAGRAEWRAQRSAVKIRRNAQRFHRKELKRAQRTPTRTPASADTEAITPADTQALTPPHSQVLTPAHLQALSSAQTPAPTPDFSQASTLVLTPAQS